MGLGSFLRASSWTVSGTSSDEGEGRRGLEAEGCCSGLSSCSPAGFCLGFGGGGRLTLGFCCWLAPGVTSWDGSEGGWMGAGSP